MIAGDALEQAASTLVQAGYGRASVLRGQLVRLRSAELDGTRPRTALSAERTGIADRLLALVGSAEDGTEKPSERTAGSRLAERIRELVGASALAEAIGLLAGLSEPSLSTRAILLAGRLRRSQDASAKNTLPQAEVSAVLNTLAGTLVEIADEIENSLSIACAPIETPVGALALSGAYLQPDNLEKIVTSSRNLRPVGWLEDGVRAARSVCRITAPNGTGTGFMISRKRLMTCNHVIPTEAVARTSVAEFNYVQHQDGGLGPVISCKLAPQEFFRTSPWKGGLDYTITAVEVPASGLSPDGSEWVRCDADAPIYMGDLLAIIQHPSGLPKKIAIGSNHVAGLWEHRLHYTADTLEGASGAPVLNDDWKVIALHHGGGDMQVTSRGDTRYVNEGILISAVVSDMGSDWQAECTTD